MEARQDYPTEEAGQGRLHYREGVEANLAPSDTWQGPGVGDRGTALPRCRDLQPPSYKPL